MEKTKLKHINAFLLLSAASGLIAMNYLLFYTSLVLLISIWLHNSLKPEIKVKKIRFNKDTGEFQVNIENNTAFPLHVKYSIHSVTSPQISANLTTKKEGMEFMQGQNYSQQNSYLLLSENSLQNTVASGKTTAIASGNMAAEQLWNPRMQNIVQLTISYANPKQKPEIVTVNMPVEISTSHPYLRNIGPAREFIFAKDANILGKAKSLKELASFASENQEEFLPHYLNGDVQKWIKDAIGDKELHESLSIIEDENKSEIPRKFIEVINHRIEELNQSNFKGKHPFLSEVEEWHAFNLKSDENTLIKKCNKLESLLEAINNSPIESIKFHLSKGNDYANWIQNVIGDKELAERLRIIDSSNKEYAKLIMSRTISERVRELSG